jgi:hypothetical protein
LQDKITTQIAGVLATRVAQIEQRRALAKPTAIISRPTNTCAPGPPCSSRGAPRPLKRAHCSDAPLHSIPTTLCCLFRTGRNLSPRYRHGLG